MVGSGLGASTGIASETTYGTFAAPTKFLEVNKSDAKKTKNIAQGGGLASGRLAQPGARRVQVTEQATGSIEIEGTRTGLGLLLQHIFGGTPTPVQNAATTAYTQSFPLVDNIGKYLTLQNGVPDTSNVVRPYTFKGGKVTSAEFTCSAPDGLLMITLEFDFQKASEVESITAPSYVARIPFHFGDMRVRLGTTGAETAVPGVKGWSVKLERAMKVDRFYASTVSPGVKAEPLINGWAVVSGSLDVDFLDKTVFADRFASDTPTSMVVEFISSALAGTGFPFSLAFATPMVFFEDTPTSIDGPDVISGSVPFTAQLDASNPLLTATYVSTDTTP